MTAILTALSILAVPVFTALIIMAAIELFEFFSRGRKSRNSFAVAARAGWGPTGLAVARKCCFNLCIVLSVITEAM